MHAILRYRKTAAFTLGLFVAAVAWAAISTLQITASVTNGSLSISTSVLPSGWFVTRNTFDNTRTELVTTYTFGGTTCSDPMAGGTLSSVTSGTFAEMSSPNGYSWAGSVNISAYANHWHNQYHCDGSVSVIGCDQAIPVTVTTTNVIVNNNGQTGCRTYVNNSGQSVCESDTETTSLAAIYDANLDVTDLCDPSCGIGECSHTCEREYCAGAPPGGKDECMWECTCLCKANLPDSCPAHHECDP